MTAVGQLDWGSRCLDDPRLLREPFTAPHAVSWGLDPLRGTGVRSAPLGHAELPWGTVAQLEIGEEVVF